MRSKHSLMMLPLSVMAVGVILLIGSVSAQNQKKNITHPESYTRPKPTKPIQPQIPEADRYQDDKVFLEYADSLFRPKNEYEEFQIVKGSVKFRQGSMWMFCDSAYYYPEKNSMDAFGHVEMRQGDTLFVYADKLFYDGAAKHATLTHGPSRSNVQLKDPKVTLTTDSLDYDLNSELGWYSTGGRLEDDVNALTSIYGEYSPANKMARFRNDVLLVNNKDGYRMITEELEYNTDTHIATINMPTRIEGANDTIITSRGWYDTRSDHAQLTSRSTILHRDSNANVTSLEGDSIIYDKLTRTSRAFMFRDPYKVQKPMVLTDTARKVTLIGGYGEYNDSTRLAYSTGYPLLMEYSRKDTLFLRADTILSIIESVMVWPDSLSKPYPAATRTRLERYKSPLDAALDMPSAQLTLMSADIKNPGWKLANDNANLPTAADISENKEHAAIINEKELSLPADDDMNDSNDKAPPGRRVDKFGRDSAFMVPRDFHKARAIGRARFFNEDIQGVADTLLFQERDSMLFMIKKPIVWTGERQVYGNAINVHFNDSAPDWAELPQSGFVAEHIAEDFYDQMTGSYMKAYLKDQKLRRLDVEGNVQTIFLPQEKDSTYNKLVYAESSYLTLLMDSNKIEHLKMWPEVTGSVTPLFELKKANQYIEGFRWLEKLRPQRNWYGTGARWADELGEVSEELDEYFSQPPLIKSAPMTPALPARGTAKPVPPTDLISPPVPAGGADFPEPPASADPSNSNL